MTTLQCHLGDNLEQIRQRVAAACARAGREREDVQAIAVTKYAAVEWVREIVRLGETRLGESRPQQLLERAELLATDSDLPAIEWHLIGHLQRNKVRPILPVAALIHSIDSIRLLDRVDRLADELGLRPRVLLEVNVSGEASKDGFAPEVLLDQWSQVVDFAHVSVDGLMTMAPDTDDATVIRGCFRGLRELRDRLRGRSPSYWELPELSMGMSGDFEIAIEEGSTLVRIGSALFDRLPQP